VHFATLLVRSLSLVVSKKFTFFNKQQHRADTATNSKPAAMLDVSSHAAAAHVSSLLILLFRFDKTFNSFLSAFVQSRAWNSFIILSYFAFQHLLSFAIISTQANKSIPAIWADSHILSSFSLIFFGFRVDRLLIRLRILLRSQCAGWFGFINKVYVL